MRRGRYGNCGCAATRCGGGTRLAPATIYSFNYTKYILHHHIKSIRNYPSSISFHTGPGEYDHCSAPFRTMPIPHLSAMSPSQAMTITQ